MPLKVYPFKNAKEKAEAKKNGTLVLPPRARAKERIAIRKVEGHGHKRPSAFARGEAQITNLSETAPQAGPADTTAPVEGAGDGAGQGKGKGKKNGNGQA